MHGDKNLNRLFWGILLPLKGEIFLSQQLVDHQMINVWGGAEDRAVKRNKEFELNIYGLEILETAKTDTNLNFHYFSTCFWCGFTINNDYRERQFVLRSKIVPRLSSPLSPTGWCHAHLQTSP